MDKVFIGNEAAFSIMRNYICMDNPGPLILLGKHGLGKRMAAMEIASNLLKCPKDDLVRNPDFYLLDKVGIVKVDDIMQLLERSKTAAMSDRKIYLICNAEKINVQGQNKLLKLMEDKNNNNILILLSNQDILLETIKSRSCIIPFFSFSTEELAPYFKANGIADEDIELMSYICDFCPYSLSQVTEYVQSLKDTYHDILHISEKKELFNVLHLTREKDPQNFYEVHSSHFLYALHMLEYVFMQILLNKKLKNTKSSSFQHLDDMYTLSHVVDICCSICTHQKHFQSGSYSKNVFFDLVRLMNRDYDK